MNVSVILTSALVALLSGFLAFSAMVENMLMTTFVPQDGTIATQEVAPEIEESPVEIEVEELSVLPSEFENQEYGGPIPSILLDTATSQGASIVLTAPSAEVKGTSSTSTLSTPRPVASLDDTLVNVFCTLKSKNEVRATTGSGVFIDERGVVLTNAHVAQFLLLSDDARGIKTQCVLRRGSPAVAEYTAELLYISPLWVNANAEQLKSDNPSGTGERDYALLYVTGALDSSLPEYFPSLSFDTSALRNSAKNQAVLAAGFPAEIIRTEGTKATLRPVIATTTITELFTYTRNKVDLVGIAPSAVGEGGSSGGPIVTLDGSVIGLISTRGNAQEGAKSLRAITVAYIDRTIESETGVDLRTYLKDNLPERARIFRATLTPLLSRIVTDALKASR